MANVLLFVHVFKVLLVARLESIVEIEESTLEVIHGGVAFLRQLPWRIGLFLLPFVAKDQQHGELVGKEFLRPRIRKSFSSVNISRVTGLCFALSLALIPPLRA